MSKVIVIGNEKGGSGKTTTAMHLIVSLLKLGFSVASIDLDSRQQSLTRYIENRSLTLAKDNANNILMPEHITIQKSDSETEISNFLQILNNMSDKDFIVIDTPGSDTESSRIAHSNANMVITPINDSFIDLDLIGQINADTLESVKPGIYSAMLWEQKIKRAAEKSKELSWVIVRNRLSTMDAINRRNVELALNKLARKFGFKVAPGFGDRVIFKELFPKGLTLHDTASAKTRVTPSVIAARQELRNFIQALGIPEIAQKLAAA